MKKIIFFSLAGVLFWACQRGEKRNDTNECKHTFIDSCAMVVVNFTEIDEVSAQEQCTCAYETLYAIDSSYFSIENGSEASAFIKQHYNELDSLCNISEFQTKIRNERNSIKYSK
jgi:hydroxylamine reductase (hybrid-cluster protein)